MKRHLTIFPWVIVLFMSACATQKSSLQLTAWDNANNQCEILNKKRLVGSNKKVRMRAKVLKSTRVGLHRFKEPAQIKPITDSRRMAGDMVFAYLSTQSKSNLLDRYAISQLKSERLQGYETLTQPAKDMNAVSEHIDNVFLSENSHMPERNRQLRHASQEAIPKKHGGKKLLLIFLAAAAIFGLVVAVGDTFFLGAGVGGILAIVGLSIGLVLIFKALLKIKKEQQPTASKLSTGRVLLAILTTAAFIFSLITTIFIFGYVGFLAGFLALIGFSLLYMVIMKSILKKKESQRNEQRAEFKSMRYCMCLLK